MDRRSFLKTGIGAAGLTLGAPYVARGAGPLTLRWAHFAQEDHPGNIAAKQFASRVDARTAGAIKINIFPNNVLGGPPEQAQQIKLGTIDMGLPTQGQLDKYDLAFAAAMLPFIFDNPAHVYRVLDGPAMDWLAPLAGVGVEQHSSANASVWRDSSIVCARAASRSAKRLPMAGEILFAARNSMACFMPSLRNCGNSSLVCMVKQRSAGLRSMLSRMVLNRSVGGMPPSAA